MGHGYKIFACRNGIDTLARMVWGIFAEGLDYEHIQITAAGIQSKENHLLQNILIYDRKHGRIEKWYIVYKLGSIWEIFLTTEALVDTVLDAMLQTGCS